MNKKKQVKVLKYFLGRIYRSDKHKSHLDARITGIKAKRRVEGCPEAEDPASIRYWMSDIEDRILEQKREIDLAIAQVMDILDYLPIHSIERQICELRHIDFKLWGVKGEADGGTGNFPKRADFCGQGFAICRKMWKKGGFCGMI